MKQLILAAAAAFGLAACTPKPQPNPVPEEYFSFDANGVHYDYPQEVVHGWTGVSHTIGAGSSSSSVGYIISAYSRKDATAEGTFSFYLRQNSNQLPTEDTLILDGGTNTVEINKFKSQDSSYTLRPPLTGKIIFSEKSAAKIVGTFYFDAFRYNVYTGAITDTIIHITNGKFSILLNH